MAGKKKMLVIEEELVTARMIAYDLSGVIATVHASNWIEAVKYLREERFTIVMVNLALPDLPALSELFDFVHGIDPDYRIIPVFASEKDKSNNLYTLMRSGVEYSLAFPWGKDELAGVVNQIICES